jgi:hypothetical protein
MTNDEDKNKFRRPIAHMNDVVLLGTSMMEMLFH